MLSTTLLGQARHVSKGNPKKDENCEKIPLQPRDERFSMQAIRDHQEMLRPAVAALAELERHAQITFFDVQSKAQMIMHMPSA